MTKPEWANYHGRGHRVVRTIDSHWPIVHERGDRPLAAPRAACSTQLCTALLLLLLPTPPLRAIGGGQAPSRARRAACFLYFFARQCILGIILRTLVPNAYDPSAAPGHNHSTPSSYPVSPVQSITIIGPFPPVICPMT